MKKSYIIKNLRKFETLVIWSSSKKSCIEITSRKANTAIDIRCNPGLVVETHMDKEDEYRDMEAEKKIREGFKNTVDMKKYFS